MLALDGVHAGYTTVPVLNGVTIAVAEIIRDSALQASGLLSEKIGGPSVHPATCKLAALMGTPPA